MQKRLRHILMNSNLLSRVRAEFCNELKNKEILDIILFGSAIKGKAMPNDMDIAIISDKELKISKNNFHISMIKPKDFFINRPSIIPTLLKEGYSLRNKKLLSELYGLSNKVLFKYELKDHSPSKKVKAVFVLRGKNKQKGMVEENGGEWLANQIFIVPPENQHIFEQFFQNFNIKYIKTHLLMD